MDSILYEDNHLLVINKPSGLLTQPSGTSEMSAEAMGKAYLKERYQKKGKVFLEAVHRLDRLTSGVCIFARTSKALSRLVASVRERACRKIYWAWVEGQILEPGTLIHRLFHDNGFAKVVKEGGKEAVMHYKPLKQKGSFTLLEIELVTGRYHQIRAQLKAFGCPIVGDTKYGSRCTQFGSSIALHCKEMSFPHPTQDKVIEITAPLPAILQQISHWAG